MKKKYLIVIANYYKDISNGLLKSANGILPKSSLIKFTTWSFISLENASPLILFAYKPALVACCSTNFLAKFFFFGSMFFGSLLMALYIIFIRPIIHGDIGLENTWAFFNLIFLQNLSAFIVGFYSIKINKLGTNEKTSIEGVIAPGILTLLSAILCYGLADKIYMY